MDSDGPRDGNEYPAAQTVTAVAISAIAPAERLPPWLANDRSARPSEPRAVQRGGSNSSGCNTICEEGRWPQHGVECYGKPHRHLPAGRSDLHPHAAPSAGGEGARLRFPFDDDEAERVAEALTPLKLALRVLHAVARGRPADHGRQPYHPGTWPAIRRRNPQTRSRCSPLILGGHRGEAEGVAAQHSAWA